MKVASVRARVGILVAIAACVGGGLARTEAIAQPLAYHAFADARTLLGIPRALDVCSNAPFFCVGAFGLLRMKRWAARLSDLRERGAYALFFVGVLCTAFGSAYYHLAPTNERLVWDRLPMAVGFMSLFAAQVGEHVDLRAGRRLVVPCVAAGLASVVYWAYTEHVGRGDLRPYLFVQGFPMLALPVMFALFPSRYSGVAWLWGTLGLYLLAKLLEAGDARVFAWTNGLVSGHTLKHLAAGAATFLLLPMLLRRTPRVSRPTA